MKKICAFLLFGFVMQLQAGEDFNSEVRYWSKFVEELHNSNKLYPTGNLTEKLVGGYLSDFESLSPVLDLGCRLGENGLFAAESNHNICFFDIAPNAIVYAMQNVKEQGLEDKVLECNTGDIITFPLPANHYKAIVSARYFLSHIPKCEFRQVIKKIYDALEPGGYFGTNLFGDEHQWIQNIQNPCSAKKTFLSLDEVSKMLESIGFTICEIQEIKSKEPTVYEGMVDWHKIEVIAKK